MALDIAQIRQQFPILRSGEIVYLDSAATAQKPESVIEAMDRHLREDNANVHRGMHILAERSTIAYEEARKAVASFIGAKSYEIVFTKNCTEAINLVAKSWGKTNLKKEDTVLLSILEHHSNIVPWLQLKEEIGINVEWFDIEPETITENVKLVAVTGLSNVLGIKPNTESITKKAHAVGAKVLVDAAQLVTHEKVDVQKLDCDFLSFSGHKLYGPTGIGVLYAKRELLEEMPPFLGGGMMIGTVKRDHFTSAEIPQKFEAGTPCITEAVGLHAAIDWLSQFDWKDIQEHEYQLMNIAIQELSKIEGLTILPNSQLPTTSPQIGCLSFTFKDIHPHDLTEALGKQGICLRAGHHCAEPLHEKLGVTASTRMSFGIYNTEEDIQQTTTAITRLLHRNQ